MNPVLQGQIRAFLAAASGIAISMGWMDDEVAGIIVGGGMYVITAFWSYLSKKK
jgi:hypothetical protein